MSQRHEDAKLRTVDEETNRKEVDITDQKTIAREDFIDTVDKTIPNKEHSFLEPDEEKLETLSKMVYDDNAAVDETYQIFLRVTPTPFEVEEPNGCLKSCLFVALVRYLISHPKHPLFREAGKILKTAHCIDGLNVYALNLFRELGCYSMKDEVSIERLAYGKRRDKNDPDYSDIDRWLESSEEVSGSLIGIASGCSLTSWFIIKKFGNLSEKKKLICAFSFGVLIGGVCGFLGAKFVQSIQR